MVPTERTYVPGVCNIGRAEVRQRQIIAWAGLLATIVLWGVFVFAETDPVWRLFLFIPAAIAALGYLQSAWHFCAAFGLTGVFNLGPAVGRTDTVEQAEYRRQDRRTALLILGLSALTGIVVGAAGYFVPV